MSSHQHKFTSNDSFLKKCFDTFISLGKIVVKSKKGSKLPKGRSEKCIVLGNGPSLKKSLVDHPTFFNNHELFCVNSFSLTPEYIQLKPSYYVMLDPGLWLGNTDLSKNTFENIRSKTTWPLTLYIPRSASGESIFSELQKSNKNITIIFFNYTVYKGFKSIGYWLFKHNLAMPQSQNVLVASLFLSVNMKFKEVYLFGADHGWHQDLHINEENVVCFKNVHFYENQEKINYKPFYKGLHLKETFTMDEIFATWSKVFIGYMVLNDYANACGCSIYNTSTTSFIDAFKRIKIQ